MAGGPLATPMAELGEEEEESWERSRSRFGRGGGRKLGEEEKEEEEQIWERRRMRLSEVKG